MIIAVFSTDRNIDSKAGGIFGKACYVFVADTESRVVKILDISRIAALPFESGRETAELLIRAGVNCAAAGAIDDECREVLSGKGVRVFTGVSGTAREMIDHLASGGCFENK